MSEKERSAEAEWKGELAVLAAACALLCLPVTSFAHKRMKPPIPEAPAVCAPVPRWRFSPTLAKNPYPHFRRPASPAGSRSAYGPLFVVEAANAGEAGRICDMAEQRYPMVLAELGLSTITHRGRYPITVYSSEDEYRRKARQPDASAGVAAGNAIYTFRQEYLDVLLAHELTHIALTERWGDRAFPWLSEGLACVVEERLSFRERELRRSTLRLLMTVGVMPRLDEMRNYLPGEPVTNDSMIRREQISSLVDYMLDNAGRERLGAFIETLEERSVPAAFSIAMSDVWPDMRDLETEWTAWLWQAQHLDPARE